MAQWLEPFITNDSPRFKSCQFTIILQVGNVAKIKFEESIRIWVIETELLECEKAWQDNNYSDAT